MSEIKCAASPEVERKLTSTPKEIAKVLADSSPADIACIVRRTAFPENSIAPEKAGYLFAEVARLNPTKAAKAAIIMAQTAKGDNLQEMMVPDVVLASEYIRLRDSSEFSFNRTANKLTNELLKLDPKLTEQLLTARAFRAVPLRDGPAMDGETSYWQAQVRDAVQNRMADLKKESVK